MTGIAEAEKISVLHVNPFIALSAVAEEDQVACSY